MAQFVNIMKYLLALTLGIVLLISGSMGCGVYTFNPKGKTTLSSLAVLRFENRTPEYGLTDRITDEIIDAFIADGTFKILPSDAAESILEGVLVRYQRKPYTYDQNDQVQEYKVEMDFDITLKNAADDSQIWSERINQIATYDVLDETEEDAQQKVVILLIEDIINKTTRSW